jgi:glycosyltransferase involved in cell wall biosynthesis
MRTTQFLRLTVQELKAIRAASRISGGRDALIARARHHLDITDVSSLRLHALETAQSNQEGRFRAELDRLGAERNRLAAQYQQLARSLAQTDDHVRRLEAATDVRLKEIDTLQRRASLLQQIHSVTTWVRNTRIPTTTRISVVLATYNRAELLAQAIESVRVQEYPNWELVVVDDGSSDGTPEVLKRLSTEDKRIVVVTEANRGLSGARNTGLSMATGEILCYQDDDNLMQPLWLKAVAWAFGRDNNLEVLYGARVVDVAVGGNEAPDDLPYTHLEAFDRSRLEFVNYIDAGTIAHRRNLPEAHFDESLQALEDWDLVLRLTERRTPLVLPVVALAYAASAPNRLTHSERPAAAYETVQMRLRRRTPLRVLAYSSHHPLVTQTNIRSEMKALTDNGATVAWCNGDPTPSPVSVNEPSFTDIGAAVSNFAPDVIFLHSAGFARTHLPELKRIALPFGVRIHSSDFNPELIERVRAHPLCIGIWAYPHHAHRIQGSFELVNLLTDLTGFPEPDTDRPIVITATAGLPKRDWPTLIGAFAPLADKGIDCRIILGTTGEEMPSAVREMISGFGAPIKLTVDLPHDQVLALLSKTAAVVYTNRPEEPFGMPTSVIEGMYAATSVILPARPESALVAGPRRRTYVEAGDIVRHVTEILAGGPRIDAERAFNREFARTRFADPDLATTFAAQLATAVARWRDSN